MKKVLFIAVLVMLSTFCFGEFYGEYSFDEVDKINTAYLNGNGWGWSFIVRRTRAEIQKEIDEIEKNVNADARRVYYASCMRKILRANSDKRIFLVDYTWPQGPFGFMFIKINENEFLWFFTGR